jgi:hypothetical protein
MDILRVFEATLQRWITDIEEGETWWGLLSSALIATNCLVLLFCGVASVVARVDRVARSFLRVQTHAVMRFRLPLLTLFAVWVVGRVLLRHHQT